MSHIKVTEMPSKNAKIPTTTYPKKPLLAKILADEIKKQRNEKRHRLAVISCYSFGIALIVVISALDHIVRSGKALYVGISNYNAEQTKQMAEIMKSLGTPLVIHQPRYNMFERWIENGLQDVLKDEGIGSISFCPLAQGLLTNKYINGIPADSRAAKSSPFLTKEGITADKIEKIVKLNKIAENRGQSLAQMACAWNLRGGKLTSVLLGASKASQIIENVNSLNNLDFTQDELNAIEDALK